MTCGNERVRAVAGYLRMTADERVVGNDVWIGTMFLHAV